ncbi:MAG: DUF502 domain-containing protein [Bdellovibrionales bacterium]|nr:DUF502 domain-containing protein [Bdellovibrionales bacterium]
MKHVTSTFLKGLFTALPLLLSIYVFIWFLALVERNTSQLLLVFWPEFLYIPGMGVVLAFALIYLLGTVVDKPWSRWFFNLTETLLSEVPVVKTVYMAIKDFTDFLKPKSDRKSNQVVLVKFPGSAIEMIGLMTRENLKDMPEPVTKEERVAVYLPMSYQFGGVTVFIPRAWVTPTNMSVEAAMRSIITAWLPGQDKKLENV